MRPARGFTLIELLVACAVIAIVLSSALPQLRQWKQRQQVNAAGRALVGELQQARSLALEKHSTVFVALHESCYVVASTPDCPCGDEGSACAWRSVETRDVRISPAREAIAFEPRLGSTSPGEVARLSLGSLSVSVEAEAAGRAEARLLGGS